MSQTKIIERINRIIALANSTTHPEEAETFMAKVHEMLEQYGLTLLEVGRLDEEDPIEHLEDRQTLRANGQAKWRTMVANQLAIYYGCQLVKTKYRGDNFEYWTVFGRRSALTTFNLMYPYVDRQILAVAREEVRKGHFANNKQAHSKVGIAMVFRLQRLNQEKAEASTRDAATSNTLVPVDQIRLAMENFFGKLSEGKVRTLNVDRHAAAAAEGISLALQTTGGKAKQLTSS